MTDEEWAASREAWASWPITEKDRQRMAEEYDYPDMPWEVAQHVQDCMANRISGLYFIRPPKPKPLPWWRRLFW